MAKVILHSIGSALEDALDPAEATKNAAHLAELEAKHGTKPNIIHIMWDDMAFGDAGIPALNKVRGFDTPGCNRMAEEGALFTRYYTEPACTPSRAAVITGPIT